MQSIRNKRRLGQASDDALLDAARDRILSVGVRRATLTDVARQAGVSRMTLYRRWPDVQSLVADLMTREWLQVAAAAEGRADPAGSAADRLVHGVTATVGALREHPLFRKIVEVDPERLLPYLIDRRGRTQDAVLDRLEATIAAGHADGSVRRGEPRVLATAVLLAAQGFALSVPTMADRADVDDLDAELRALVERYLAP